MRPVAARLVAVGPALGAQADRVELVATADVTRHVRAGTAGTPKPRRYELLLTLRRPGGAGAWVVAAMRVRR